MRAPGTYWTVERLGGIRDLDGVVAVAEASFRHGWTRAMFSRELERPDTAHLFVARGSTGEVAGYCSTWLVSGELHINGLAVAPALRRQGAARALVRHVVGEARRLGAHEATLEVRSANRVARRLYESLGFTPRGLRPRYYVQPVDDALILGRRL